MVSLAPPLKAVLEIRLHIENGSSITEAIRFFTQRNLEDPFAKDLGCWLFAHEKGKRWESKELALNPYRRYLIEILSKGIVGEPILENLVELEKDLRLQAEQDLDQQLQKLPFLSLIPLMLFEFPAFILLLLGPLVLDLLSVLQNLKGVSRFFLLKILAFFFMLLSLLSGDKSFSLTLDTILQASHPKTLKTALNQTQQFKQFQQLCDFQKKEEKLPYALL